MDDPLRVIAEQLGVFLRREALACGYDDKTIARMLRGNIWHRVRHGAYCFADVWSTYTPEERHLTLARAVLRTTPGPVVLSHTTALLVHGIAVWGANLSRVHVTRLDRGAARTERDVVHHVGLCPEADVTVVAGLAVVTPARAVVEAATVQNFESAIVSADNALFLGGCTDAALREMFGQLHHWPGSQKIHVLLQHMDGRAGSVGESRSRFLFWRRGLPRPELQFKVYDAYGRLVAVTDFAWHKYGVFGEFDGKMKYGRFLKQGEEPGDVVFWEKQREDPVRAITGYGCARLVWAHLSSPVGPATGSGPCLASPPDSELNRLLTQQTASAHTTGRVCRGSLGSSPGKPEPRSRGPAAAQTSKLPDCSRALTSCRKRPASAPSTSWWS